MRFFFNQEGWIVTIPGTFGGPKNDRKINGGEMGPHINDRKNKWAVMGSYPLFLWSYGPLLITGFWSHLVVKNKKIQTCVVNLALRLSIVAATALAAVAAESESVKAVVRVQFTQGSCGMLSHLEDGTPVSVSSDRITLIYKQWKEHLEGVPQPDP